ncbi:MAG: aldo/keto reductase [Pseudomonadota bacterium]
MAAIPTTALPSGETVPVLGQGTWQMGERLGAKSDEVRALRVGLDLGMSLIDTAEMYADGGAEQVVREAVRGRRDEVFLVSKVYPQNASFEGAQRACERSLGRLGTDRIDLYLLHWRGHHPLAETVRAFVELQAAGKIRHWGVSNLDTDELEELWLVADGSSCATDQVLFNVGRRGPEHDLLPWCGARGVPVMAYSPLEQGRLDAGTVLDEIGAAHGVDRYAVALAWVLNRPGIVAIPKATRPAHVEANARAVAITLTADELAAIDTAFPPPATKRPLAVL